MTDSTDNTDSSVSSVSPAPPRTTVPTIDLPTTTEDRMSTQPTTSTTVEAAAPTSAERLSGDEPYVLAFGGQATPWRATLDELSAWTRSWRARSSSWMPRSLRAWLLWPPIC